MTQAEKVNEICTIASTIEFEKEALYFLTSNITSVSASGEEGDDFQPELFVVAREYENLLFRLTLADRQALVVSKEAEIDRLQLELDELMAQ